MTDIGIGENGRKQIAEGLSGVLADSYLLMLKSHRYHWNVAGPQFKSLHELFEEHYTDLFGAVDEIAERILALGHKAPGSFSEFAELAEINEDTTNPDSATMVANLLKDHETLVKRCKAVQEMAEDAGDDVSGDLMIGRQDVHQKTAWMLRATLDK
jgi:starvation-inducible DNA-binding protein